MYDAFFVDPDIEPDKAVAIGLQWLVQQPGDPLVLFHAKNMVDNNRLLGRAIRDYHIRYEAPLTIHRSRWSGGAVLAPWASRKVLRCIDDDLANRATGVCVIGWMPDDPAHAAWIAARGAVDLADGSHLGRRPEEIIADPVVRIALDEAERFVNHNNALVQAEDKAYFVRTLQELVRGGHFFEVEQLAAYAMSTGWTAPEVDRIRDYGERVLAGRTFRLRSTIGPQRGACGRWEAEARAARDA
jgi:hypothetical protein